MGLTGCCGKESTRLLKQLREEEFILAYSWRGNSPYVGEELVAGGGAETDECWCSAVSLYSVNEVADPSPQGVATHLQGQSSLLT